MNTLTQRYGPEINPGIVPTFSIQKSYDRYYTTGLYTRRYPKPNPYILRIIFDALGSRGGHVLDFGCGCGRYALPLARQSGVSVFAYDISPVAIRDLGRRRDELARQDGVPLALETLCGDLDDLAQRLDGAPGFDLVLLLFGVLGHIPQRVRRVALLRSLRQRLRPGGSLIISVPNRMRRFRPEQREARRLLARGALEAGDIYYQRHSGTAPIDLYYHLYSPAEFRAELAEAGFGVTRLQPESVLAERAIVSSPLCSAADTLLRAIVPLPLAYGFVAVATPAASPSL